MKNRLTDLNDHLFAQMERLGNEDLTPEELQHELARSKALTGISRNIIDNGKLVLAAQIELGGGTPKLPALLGVVES